MRKLIVALGLIAAVPVQADQINLLAGSPICVSNDNLATAIAAKGMFDLGLSEPPVVAGCEFIEQAAAADVLERFPSPHPDGRMVRVRVKIDGKDITGLAIEHDSNP